MLSWTENLKAAGWLEFWDTGVGGTAPGAWLGCTGWGTERDDGCGRGICKRANIHTGSYVNTYSPITVFWSRKYSTKATVQRPSRYRTTTFSLRSTNKCSNQVSRSANCSQAGVCVKSSLPLRYKPRRAKPAWRGDPYLHKASGALNSLFRKYRDTINNYLVVNTLLLLV